MITKVTRGGRNPGSLRLPRSQDLPVAAMSLSNADLEQLYEWVSDGQRAGVSDIKSLLLSAGCAAWSGGARGEGNCNTRRAAACPCQDVNVARNTFLHDGRCFASLAHRPPSPASRPSPPTGGHRAAVPAKEELRPRLQRWRCAALRCWSGLGLTCLDRAQPAAQAGLLLKRGAGGYCTVDKTASVGWAGIAALR